MNIGIIASQNKGIGSTPEPQPLQANAGGDIVVSRFSPYALLDGSASTGAITSYHWEELNLNGLLENGNVMSPDTVKTPVNCIQYRGDIRDLNNVLRVKGEYHYRLTVSDGVDTSTDDMKVTVTWDDVAPQRNSSGGWRYLTAGDYMTVPNGAIGDYYIDGANDGEFINGQFTDIYLHENVGVTLGPGKKILIKAGKYGNIQLRFANGNVAGTELNPVIITNSGGQVECQNGISVTNASYYKLTGKYVPGVSGHIGYQGHDAGYAFSQGKYGIYANFCWNNTSGAGVYLNGTAASYGEVEYVEAGNGGFTGIYIKNDTPGSAAYYNNKVHDNYIHDTGGEGVYIGTTSTNNPQQLFNLQFYNNRIIRAGNDGVQFGQLAGGCRIYNNVVFMAATRWISPFNDTQVFGSQLGLTNGDNQFYNNIVIGAGEQLFSAICVGGYNTQNNIDNIVDNNLFLGSKGFIAGYGDERVGGLGTSVLRITNNFMGKHNFLQDRIYQPAYSHAINTQQQIRLQFSSGNVQVDGNTRDNTKTTMSAGATATNTIVDTNIPVPTFNSGFSSSYYTNYSLWATKIYDSMGDEYETSPNIKIGDPYNFSVGDLVFWQGKFYTSKVNGNFANMPAGVTDAYWTKLTWTDGVTTYDYPPDDFREQSTDYFRSRNIGLIDTI